MMVAEPSTGGVVSVRNRWGPGARGIVIGTPEQVGWLDGIAKWILVFNLLDGVFTLVWVEYFQARELNVMMSDLVHSSALLFMMAKLTLVSLGTLFLWRLRSNPLAVISLFVAFFSYYLVLLVHLEYSSVMFL
jgi:hypothetical protein